MSDQQPHDDELPLPSSAQPGPLSSQSTLSISSITAPHALFPYEESNNDTQTSSYSSGSSYFNLSAYRSSLGLAPGYHIALIGFGTPCSRNSCSPLTETSSYINSRGSRICTLSWGGDVYTSNKTRAETRILLPPHATLVGVASSVDDLNQNGSEIHVIPNVKPRVFIKDKCLGKITHIAFRNSSQMQLSRCIARKLKTMEDDSTFGQICEAGPVISDDADVATVSFHQLRRNGLQVGSPKIIITSTKYHLIEEGEINSSTVHSIPKLKNMDELLNCIPFDMPRYIRRKKLGTGIILKQPLLPWLIVISCIVLWIIPAAIQLIGGVDRNWATVVNQSLSTGSILVISILYTIKTLLPDNFISDAMSGVLVVRDDKLARVIAPYIIRRLQSVACDPRLPTSLVIKDCNSAVRVRRNGWLRIGRKIPIRDMDKHGYHVLMDKGIILDLIDATFYKMEQTNDGNERIRRYKPMQEQWQCHVVNENALVV